MKATEGLMAVFIKRDFHGTFSFQYTRATFFITFFITVLLCETDEQTRRVGRVAIGPVESIETVLVSIGGGGKGKGGRMMEGKVGKKGSKKATKKGKARRKNQRMLCTVTF